MTGGVCAAEDRAEGSTWNIRSLHRGSDAHPHAHGLAMHRRAADLRYPAHIAPAECCSLGLSVQELFLDDRNRNR
ncbi:MAG: hypothetical protein KBF94_02685 [Ilumatobacteraceae bacterium]|jgi:hypothetical protein|nr:hypothetical protein [Ilumatobacteraceae bacterium]